MLTFLLLASDFWLFANIVFLYNFFACQYTKSHISSS